MVSLQQLLLPFGQTCTSLDISRKNLWEKMKKLGIHTDETDQTQ